MSTSVSPSAHRVTPSPLTRLMLSEMGIGCQWHYQPDRAGSRVVGDSDSRTVRSVATTAGPVTRPSLATHQPDRIKAATTVPTLADSDLTDSPLPADDNWTRLTDEIHACRRCPLADRRRQAVPGTGDTSAPELLLIGEGPGAEEDARGEPFVGVAGQLLDAMLAAIALTRTEKVYIANAVKCRPPGNRTPEPSEIAACRPFLLRQIALMKPKRILLLGRSAVRSLLNDDRSLAEMRGRCLDFNAIPVWISYHPAYLLRNLPDKHKAWEDWLLVQEALRTNQASLITENLP